MNNPHVVIIGGGITGLVAAYRLHQLYASETEGAISCTLVEKEGRLGGKIQTKRTDAYTLEVGPDSIFTRKPAGVEFMKEIGLHDTMIPVSSQGGTLVWHQGKLHPLPPGIQTGVPSDLSAFAKTKLVSLQGKARALLEVLLPHVPYPDDVSVGEFLRKRLGNEIVDTLAAPLLSGIYAGDIDHLSLQATMPMLRELYEKNARLLLGAVRQRKRVSSVSRLSGPMFITLEHGLEQLVDHVVSQITEYTDVKVNTQALDIQLTSDGKYYIHIVEEGRESLVPADAIILATPAFDSAVLLGGLEIDVRKLKTIRYASTATVSFGYTRPSYAFSLVGSGFLVPRHEGMSITACTVVSNKWVHASKKGTLLIRCYVGRDGDEEAVTWDDEKLIRKVKEDLEKTTGLKDEPEFVHIKRWESSMPQYDVGHLQRLEQIDQEIAKLPGIFLAGAAYRGMGIPDCIQDATRVSQHVKNYLHE
ncbi:protoporphyrinogen oxidase [Sulfoacidibacillus ferrooxidans]|uniref:Coproporphyrinogen III oxidase n=1 Tax=Sulfoacidibacillus ferrooxidans TaxID=2005001 RepID=A0A9X1VAY6_9BACL|nr:protoporphyrinogen oxidase [Sulfoacidibacillus ferrooxidans]MCI0184499.1 Protoporphyrinogen oxidase [Sulfoacidibacillus ferrooxidans]